jgi:glutamate dehydrogenase (NADP+)
MADSHAIGGSMSDILHSVYARDPDEKEFHQALEEVIESVKPVLDQSPQYRQEAVLERITEPERVITFRVPWLDDQGNAKVNRGFSVEMNSAIGPYKGGLRFHPSVNQSILKFLAFEQTFKNALTTMPLGGGASGSDFDPKGKSDDEVMRFCQSFMTELFHHIGANTDIPTPDIGVGAREIGYLFGMFKKLSNEFTGALTGKGINWGGSLVRPQAAGYGCVYFAAEMLATRNITLGGQTCLVSGSGNVAQHTVEKLVDLGAKVVTLSDSSGYIYDSDGIDADKLTFIKRLKNIRRGRIKDYAEKYPSAVYTEAEVTSGFNPLWSHRAVCAFPCATQNEINEKDAYNLINNNIKLVCEGANMPCKPEAIDIFLERNVLFAPGKAANAGGVAVSGLELVQNSMRLNWLEEEVDERLKIIMKGIHSTCLEAAEQYGTPGWWMRCWIKASSDFQILNGSFSAGLINVLN